MWALQRLRQRPGRYNMRSTQRIQLLTTQVRNSQKINHIFHPDTGKRQTIIKLMEGSTGEGDLWKTACSNEFGRLMQGIGGRIKGTNTMHIIPRIAIPPDRDVTYMSFVCDYKPHKTEKHRVRMCVGGDRLSFPESPSSPAASMTDVKLLLNSTISTPDARFATCDIKDFYLNTPMERPEYAFINRRTVPDEVQREYNMADKFDDKGNIFFKITRGMYGLRQAGLIAHQQLVKNLAPHGYHPVAHTTGLWVHEHSNTYFTLIVDDFGIKYEGQNNAQHLFDTLRKYYTISIDWNGEQYCGLTLQWNYNERHVTLSAPKFVPTAIEKYQYTPQRRRDAPHSWTIPAYGSKRQYAQEDSNEPILNRDGTKYIQGVNSTFLYYGQAIDSSILPAVNEIGTMQATPTASTTKKVEWLMDYAATHPNTAIRFHASDMILHGSSDVAYLVLPKARSRMAGYFYLSNKPAPPPIKPTPKVNGAVHVECKTIRNVVASVAEGETAAMFHNCQRAIPMRIALEEMGHPQPLTPMETDNATTLGFITSNIRQKKSKSWDMRCNWLRDREQQKQFHFYWNKGEGNLADYFTKHHAPAIHRKKRSIYYV